MICHVQMWSPVAALVYWRMFIKIGLPTSGDYLRLRSAIRYTISPSYSRIARENRSVGFQCGPRAPLLQIFVWPIIFDIQIALTRDTRGKNPVILGCEIFESSRGWMIRTNAFGQCNYYAIITRLSFVLGLLSRNTNWISKLHIVHINAYFRREWYLQIFDRYVHFHLAKLSQYVISSILL